MMDSIVKYPGGKHRELKYILPNIPSKIKDYYEPFVGGGSVFFAIEEKADNLFINDKSSDLMLLYDAVKKQDSSFFNKLERISVLWDKGSNYTSQITDNFSKAFAELKEENNNVTNEYVNSHVVGVDSGSFFLLFDNPKLIEEHIIESLTRKMRYLKKQQENQKEITSQGIQDIVQTAIKSAIYTYFRQEFNLFSVGEITKGERASLYLFIRQYAYSSMFRFSKSGNFNVPYGGKTYNNVSLKEKIEQYKEKGLVQLLSKTTLSSSDFELFLSENKPNKDDFIFLDPPYDSKFSTYDRQKFDESEQRRLALFMINEIQANWMLVIKDTELIRSLYVEGTSCANNNQLYLTSFSKAYSVNFKNRNNRKTDHLIITNYPLPSLH